MIPIATQQVALDNALVALEKRIKIEKCNARIKLSNQDFVKPPSEKEMVSFIQELGYSSKCISRKSSGLDRLRPSRAQILWGVIIRDTPGVSVSKKKTPAKVDRGKGMDLLSDATLLEAAQLKKTLKKIKKETHKLHASGSGDGVGSRPKVPDEQ
nr:hypothetical protein [Tanacetum cinerariifolium]